MTDWKDDVCGNESTLLFGHGFRLVVHRHIHYPKDVWLASCHKGVFSQKRLKSIEFEDAKCEAVRFTEKIFEHALKHLSEVKGGK